jgi:hypothetical protein
MLFNPLTIYLLLDNTLLSKFRIDGDKWEVRLENGNGRPTYYLGLFSKFINLSLFIYL